MAFGGLSLGWRAFPTVLAVFATSLLDAPPSEQGNPNSSLMRDCNRRATASIGSGRIVTSRNASSIDSGSTSGAVSRNTRHHLARTSRVVSAMLRQHDQMRTQPQRLRHRHGRAHAVLPRRIRSRGHHARAAPGCPPTAIAFPRKSGLSCSSTAQKNASKSRCKILRTFAMSSGRRDAYLSVLRSRRQN